MGSLTIVLGLNAIGMILMRGHAPLEVQVPFMLVALAAGAVGDVLLWRLRPGTGRILELRIFAAAFPAAFWAIYLTVVVMRLGTGWTVHSLTGMVVQAGIVGLLTSYVLARD